jgi:hypothetical protein
MSLPRSSAAVLLSGLALAALPSAALAKTCNVQRDSTKYGASYITSLKVFHTTCAKGKRVVKAFHACRKAHGGIKGRCPAKTSILGYKCKETRSSIATQITGKVTCTNGSKRVVHTYTQFT